MTRNYKVYFWLVGILFSLSLVTASWLPIHGDINFHTDIARDFLLIEEVLVTKRPTLIGPRAGGIPGVFYGPLWLYLNLPVYYLTNGSPVMTGWFWVVLFGCGCLMFFFVLKKLWNVKLAGLGLVLYATILSPHIANSIAHLGAVLLSPLWFYWFLKYLTKQKFWYLLFSYLVIGVMGHFQVAFAGPMMVLQTLWLFCLLYKQKKWWHMGAILVLLLPLSTFIWFEMRHDFLQIKAILDFIRGSSLEEKFNLLKNIRERLNLMMSVGFGLLPKPWAYLIPLLVGGWVYSRKKWVGVRKNRVLILYVYFYVGFWLIFTFFKGAVWSYYYWPFLPLSIMAFLSLYSAVNKRLFYALAIVVLMVNLAGNMVWFKEMQSFMGVNNGSWKFHYSLADKTFSQTAGEFGYFVYTPDQYGYSPKYAMQYVQKEYPQNKAYPYEKKPTTVVISAPDAIDNPYTSATYFIREKVKITSDPIKIDFWPNGYQVGFYQLSPEEIKSGTDPTIVSNMHFR